MVFLKIPRLFRVFLCGPVAARRARVLGVGRTRAAHGSRAAAVSLHKKYLALIIPAISEPGRPTVGAAAGSEIG